METRANFVLIGAFAIAGFVGIIGFFLWFARIELDRQFDYYDISFASVSGLSDASDVRFAGFPVGQVVDVRLSPDRDGTIRVRIEVTSETPVRTDSLATIESQGVTGVSFVGIDAGNPESPLLKAASDEEVPQIAAGQSMLQQLSQDAPAILSEALQVVEELRELLSDENKRRVETILISIESASRDFSKTLEDFSAVSGSVTEFALEIGRFNTTLDQLTGDLTGVFETTNTTLESISELSEQAKTTLAQGSEAITATQATMATADRYIAEDLTDTTDALNLTLAELRTELAAFGDDSRSLMRSYATAGDAATARLGEAEATLTAANEMISRIDETMATINGAAMRFDRVIAEDAGPLVADIRAAVSEATGAINTVAETIDTEFPLLLADVRSATENASRVFEDVGNDLTSASGRIEALSVSAETALDAATTTFSNANDTLAAIDQALDTGGRALSAAERAFDGADQIINEDLKETSAELRSVLANLNVAVTEAAAGIPEITEGLRSAVRSAEAAFAGLQNVMSSSGASVEDFTTSGLPQYTRLAQETRSLIDSLDSLVNRIERDPARFFLDPRTPEFRR